MPVSEDLEIVFGAPNRADSPTGHRATVAADRAATLVPEAEAVLDDWGFFAEFVPVSRGGRWLSTEDMVRRFLPIFRRDPALGLGHGVTSFMAGNVAWVGGDGDAKDRISARLLAGERIAFAFTELDHGSDVLGNEFSAHLDEEAHGSTWVLAGRKEVVSNLERARSAIVLARTEDRSDLRSLTLLDWTKRDTGPASSDTCRTLTMGMRGVPVGAADLTGATTPRAHTVGQRGQGAETVLRAFQITRTVLPAMATGTVDAALRLAVDYMSSRELYGSDLWALPHARQLVVRAWGSLLLAESLARGAVRVLHFRPAESFMVAAATKYLVPQLLNDAMTDLTTLFGSSFYAMDSPYAVLEKWMRDLVVLPIGHAGAISCLLSIVPNLPTWERRSRVAAPFDRDVFSLDAIDTEVDFGAFRLGAGPSDSLLASLSSHEVLAAFREAFPELEPDLTLCLEERQALQAACRALRPAELGPEASPEAVALAVRYSHLLAASALIGRWHVTRTHEDSVFGRSDAGLQAAFTRLTELITAGAQRSGHFRWDADRVDSSVGYIRATARSHRSLGVEAMPVAWSTTSEEHPREQGRTP